MPRHMVFKLQNKQLSFMKRILFIGWNCFYLFEDKNVFYVEKIHKIKRKRLTGPYVIKSFLQQDYRLLGKLY